MTDSLSEEAAYDVVIVGYGPTGMVLGALLGQAGHSVAIVEAYPGLYNQPRAATFDDEIMRTFQKLGKPTEIAEGTLVQTTYEWQNATGDLLMKHHFDEQGRCGWAEWYMMYQPHLEDVLDGLCTSLDNVDLFRGRRVVALNDDMPDGPTVTAVKADGDRISLGGRYVVGCDGGNSFVRRALGIDVDDFNFEAPWLVTDFRIKRPLGLPAALQVCDPAQPTAIIRIGPDHQRFSFMLHADETVEHATNETNVWDRVGHWVTPQDVELQRVAYYTFRSVSAQSWARNRVFLAGDAAHQMPPFLGQGMCSGIRDAHNLAWKLDLVLSGTAHVSLLRTYEIERAPHVRAITEKAIELGRIQTLRDPEAARARDQRWIALRLQQSSPEKLSYPGLTAGLIDDDMNSSSAGELFIQRKVEAKGRAGLFDDRVGQGFMVVSRGVEPLTALAGQPLERWSHIGGQIAWFTSDSESRTSPSDAAVRFLDVDGEYQRWFEEHECSAVIVRPDWYIYGTAKNAEELSALLTRLGSALS